MAELLLDEAAGEAVGQPAAAELLGQHERGEADRGGLVPGVPRHLRVGLVDRRGHRADLAGGEIAADALDLLLLLRESITRGTVSFPDCVVSNHLM